MKTKIANIVAFIATLVAGVATAADEADQPKVTVKTVYTGLDQPCGVAVQPSTGQVFVSESRAGQVVRFLPTELDKPAPAVTGFPVDGAGSGPMHNAGPLGLAFLHQNLIVVGGSERKDGEDVIRVYELPADEAAAKGALNFKEAKRTLTRSWSGQTKSSSKVTYWGLAMSPTALWVTSQGDADNGWVLKSSIGGNLLEDLTPFVRTKEATQVEQPMGIAIRNSREFLVISQAGKFDQSHDSVLAFFHMRGKGLLMALPVPLSDVVALAYSPQGNRLYAVDMALASPKQGGLYRLDSAIIDGRVGVKAVKLAGLDRPTALAFAPDNTLYVTATGAGESDENQPEEKQSKQGVLVKVTGDL